MKRHFIYLVTLVAILSSCATSKNVGIATTHDYLHIYYTSDLYFGSGVYTYSVDISDYDLNNDTDSTISKSHYDFTLYSSEPASDRKNIVIPAGTYTFSNNREVGTIYSGIATLRQTDSSGNVSSVDIVDGTMNVSVSNGTNTIYATFVDKHGETHEVVYQGTPTSEDGSYESNLTGDVNVDFSSMACSVRYFGDYFKNGTANWELKLSNSEGTEYLIIDIITDSNDFNAGLPAGTYTASKSLAVGTYVTRFKGGIYSMYVNRMDENNIFATIGNGTVEISQTDGVFTVKIDCYDESDYNKVTGTWTGIPTLSDYSPEGTAVG